MSNKDFNKLLSQELLMLCLQIKCPAYSGRNIIKVQPEAVPSINYIGRQLDVSYIGSEMYGEIVFCSNAFSHELSVSEYCPTIHMRPLSTEKKRKAYFEFDLNSANYLKHEKLYFDLIPNS